MRAEWDTNLVAIRPMRVSVLSCSRDVEFRTNLSTSTLRHSFHVMPLHSKEGVTIRGMTIIAKIPGKKV